MGNDNLKAAEERKMVNIQAFPGIALAARQKIKEKEYWLNKLSGEWVKSYFPLDYPQNENERRTETIIYRFPPVCFLHLMDVTRDSDLKMHIILAAVVVVLLHKYSGNNDIAIGTPLYKQDIEGDFINTVLILRNYIEEDMTFKELVLEMRETILEAVENRNYPVEMLAKQVNKSYSPGDDFPLFDVTISVENIQDRKYLQHIQTNTCFSFLRTNEYIEGILEYNAGIYKETTIRRIIDHFIRLIKGVPVNLELKLSQIDILSRQEKKQVLLDFNDTKTEYPRNKTIHQLFEEQVEKVPGNIAVTDTHANRSVTYRELNRRANHLAGYLRFKGLHGEEIVGIMVEPSVEMNSALLAILKAGGAYLPINPNYPGKRKKYLLRESGANILTTTRLLAEADEEVIRWEGEKIFLEEIFKNKITGDTGHPRRKSFPAHPLTHSPTQLCYIIYTSGSTGKPKGVLVEHRNVVRLVKNTNYLEFRGRDRILQTGALEFDASTFEIWGALLNGLELYLAAKDTILTPEKLKAALYRYNISTIWMTSPLFNEVVDADIEIFQSPGNLLVGGDVLSPSHINQVKKRFPLLNIINGYGPTENTTFSTTFRIERECSRHIPIGRPIANSTAYIIDKYDHLVPLGVEGELVVGGDGVTRGYINDPELTAEKFDQDFQDDQDDRDEKSPAARGTSKEKEIGTGKHSFTSLPLYLSTPLYRTGDLARWLPDGNIEFIGRIDHQAKIRGFRIECGEIENQLLTHEKIKEAVVLVKINENGDKYLCAYIVSVENIPKTEIENYLSKHLPGYMMPSYIMQIERIPLTANGKIDRNALPTPEIIPGSEYIAPRNIVEETLVQLWSEVLLIDNASIGIDDNFFELGGHSLKATVLVSKIHKALDVQVPLAEIFRTPTVRELAQYIKEAEKERYAAIVPVEKKEYYALSSAQQRLYILQQVELQSTAYNIPEIISLPVEPDVGKFEKTFFQLIRRHESLRTSFHMVGGNPMQKVHDAVEFKIEYYETGNHSSSVIRQRFDSAFDLSKAPLLKVGLVKTGERKYILVVVMHHIVSDGVSHEILVKDFMALFEGKELLPLRIQYKDFSQWQNSRKEKEKFKQQENYWLKEFKGEIPVLNIPTDYPRPIIQSFAGDAVNFKIGKIETQLLKTNARQEGVTLFMSVLAITSIWLSKISNQEDIIIGTPIAGRRHADLEKIIGMFVNTLALRNHPGGEKDFKNFLTKVKQKTLEAYENQEYQFEDLVEKVAVHRDASRNPLFDVMVTFQTYDRSTNDKSREKSQGNPEREKERSEVRQVDDGDRYGTSKFDLTLNSVEENEKILFTIQYSTKLFKKETIQQFVTYFKKIVSTIAKEPVIPIWKIDILSEEEKNQLLYDFNNTAREYPQNKTLHQLFEEQVNRSADNVAVIFHDRKLTYKELNRNSFQLARILKQRGMKANGIVGIMLERSVEMIIAILAILKSGGAYLPIDPDYPQERIQFMLEDSSAKILLASPGAQVKTKQVKVKAEVEESFIDVIDISNFFSSSTSPSSSSTLPCEVNPANLAYIIYTSGSTGKPRGVMVEHRSVVNLAFCQKRRFRITGEDRVLQFSSISFDASVEQIFISLYSGAGLVMVDRETLLDKRKFEEFLFDHLITHIHAVPSFLKTIDSQGTYHLKRMIAGGDICSPALAVEWYNICDFYNEYGPTETTVTSIEYLVKELEHDPLQLPIGKALDNTTVYILDRWGSPVPYRTAGELCIGGEGVVRGYLNNPELTAEKFDRDFQDDHDDRDEKSPAARGHSKKKERGIGKYSFTSLPLYPSTPLYRTGDLARWLPDNNIEFLGRSDHQVKIRGFRIEPGEIENHLLKHKEIKDAVVTAKDDNDGNKYLCAYIVLTGKSDRDRISSISTVLRNDLSQSLPGYMIPSYFIPVTEIPLTPSGKVDRKALPTPEGKSSGTYTAPRDEIEEKLVALWAEVLFGKDPLHEVRIGIDDNFFQLGGHSLKALILVARIHKEFNSKVPLAELFKTPDIRGLAGYVKKAERESYSPIEPVEKREYYTLSSAQKRLYILQHVDLSSTVYNIPAVITLREEPDVNKFEETFIQLIKRNESLRTSFHMADDQPVQKVHDRAPFSIEHFEARAGIENEIIHHFDSPFDLSQAPLLRAGIIKQLNGNYLLVVVMHHIISDGVSHEILVKDFMAFYQGNRLLPLRIQYKDFSQWQNKKKQKEALKKQEAYWLKEFEVEIPILEIPVDYPRPRVQRFEGNTLSFRIRGEDTSRLKSLALKEQVTLYMVLLAALNVLLVKLSGQEDIIIGTPVIGRRHADLEPIIGMFVNTLALRNYPQNEKTFREFLPGVRQRTLQAFENQEYPFEDLVEIISITRDAGRNPLFDVMYTLGTADAAERERTDNQKKEENQPQGNALHIRQTSKFDITFNGVESGNKLLFTAEYSTKLFRQQTIERFIAYFKIIISSIAKKPGIKLRDIEIMSWEEKQEILYDFNDTTTMYPVDKTIPQLFEEQVVRYPHHTALVGQIPNSEFQIPDKYDISITYEELNRESNHLAHQLRGSGVQPDTIVGIMVERSIEMIVGILGILKAGGAYLPIDPGYPEERIDFMLSDSRAKILLASPGVRVKAEVEENGRQLHGLPLQVINRKTDPGSAPEVPPSTSTSTCQVSAANLAYIIYTSGSTGNPKGVLTTHYNVTRVVRNTNYIDLEAGDRILQLSNYAFDGSVFDIYGALLNGSTLVLLPARKAAAVSQLSGNIEKERITIFFVTTALFNLLVDEGPGIFEHIKKVLFGGEQVSVQHTQQALEYAGKHKIIHVYGPTETTVYATHYPVDRINKNAGTIPIGSPLANTTIYLLDKNLHLIPIEVVGELYIGGYGTARGYLNQPELTAETFIPNPFVKNDRLYRTGDLGRWLPNGNIEFSGRIDYQVKIRGFRVEPGEIETHLRNHQDIKDAVVIVIETTPAHGSNSQKDKYICAYITPEKEKKLSINRVKEYLTRQLPGYMIPSYFMQVEEIPLTPNGKVNRKALPSPVIQFDREYTAPRSAVERILVQLWCEVLSSAPSPRPIGIDDNFFQLGGHSLKATILVSKIQKTLNIQLPLAEIFRTPTIRELAQYITRAPEIRYASIEPVEKRDYYVLSSAQKRLYVLQQMEPASTVYNMPEIFPLAEKPGIQKLEETFKKLIRRHETLRTSFHMAADEPVQRVHDKVEFEIEYYDLAADEKNYKLQNTNYKQIPNHKLQITNKKETKDHHSFIRSFDLSQAPLMRVGLLESRGDFAETPILVVDMHHTISDGISRNLLERDFISLFQGYDLPPLRLQYKDYAQWQNRETREKIIKAQETFWLETFSDEIPVLDLPTDYLRPIVQSFEGEVISFNAGNRVTALLKQLALSEGMTLYMLLLALCNVWLAKLCSQEDIVIGTPIAGRRHEDLQQIIGMFVNTIAMRNFPISDKTFAVFLREVKQRTLQVFENQEYPFEDLVDKVIVKRDASRNPLFDFMFVLQNLDFPDRSESSREVRETTGVASASSAKQEVYAYDHRVAKFDMALIAWESENNLYFNLQYCTRLFKKDTIQRFIRYLHKIISDILAEPKRFLSHIEIVTGEEKKQLLAAFNDTQAEYPKNKTIHRLFEEQAEKTPGHTALVGQIPNPKLHIPNKYDISITYKELNRESNRMAQRLRDKGVQPDTIVGIKTNRSIEMIIGILGILKSGAAYLPIEPGFPQERIDFMLADSKAKVLLARLEDEVKVEEKFEQLEGLHLRMIDIEKLSSPLTSTLTLSEIGPANLAYIIYTSGSTGNPKGTMVEHRSLVNACTWQARYYNITGWDKTTQYASFVFDAFVLEVFPCLIRGASLYIIDDDVRLDTGTLNQYYEKMGITMGFLPTRMGEQFMELENRSLRVLVVAGDKLQVFIKRNYHLYNNYGPTENTVVTTAFLVDKQYPNIPIGKPIHNNYLYILSPGYFRLQPIGVPGELCITGDSLSRGYLNNPELTAEKFDRDFQDDQDDQDDQDEKGPASREISRTMPEVYTSTHPTHPLTHSPIYRTGDLARWLPDGNIEFLGRIDQQVKLRGYRIELGEIENQLLIHPGIKESVVLARRREDEDQYLCAYIVPTNRAILDKPGSIAVELKEYLAHSLPGYMIPSRFIVIKRVPLTRSGKIDRNALPLPERKAGDTYTAPHSETEKKLVEIWSEVLGIEKNIIGIDNNFFELDGHSLKAAIMTSMVQTRLNVTIPLVELFKTPTIRQLSGYIQSVSRQVGMPFTGDKNLVLLKNVPNSEKHLFLVHDGSGEVDGYIEFCNHLEMNLNCWGLKADPLKNYTPKNLTIEEIAEKYLQRMKKIQSRGPYFIAGWSLGGSIAFEMARQLEQNRKHDYFLALIDANPPAAKPLNKKNKFTFTCESEVDLVDTYIKNKEIKEKLKDITEVNAVWAQVVDYLRQSSRDIKELEKLKKKMPGHILRVIPNPAKTKIDEFIYYLNMVRGLDRARRIYIPGGKINNTAHYFEAAQSIITDHEHWSDYFREPLTFHKIVGDHFSIFKIPDVIQFARRFDEAVDHFFYLANPR
jgi:tyrocidine synthetase-3